MRINVYFTKQLLEEIDTYCEANGFTRSTFLKIAAMDQMNKGVYTHKDKVKLKTSEQVVKVLKETIPGVCQHGAMKGLCKKGCK